MKNKGEPHDQHTARVYFSWNFIKTKFYSDRKQITYSQGLNVKEEMMQSKG